MKNETLSRSMAIYLLAFSLFSLAGALVFFTINISNITETVPALMDKIEDTTKAIDPVLKSVNELSALVPEILQETKQSRELVPMLLAESRKVREAIPPVLSEIQKTRELVPKVLAETTLVRDQVSIMLMEVQAMREQLPIIIKTADKTCDTINFATVEMSETRKLIPVIVAEITKTREAIPSMLQQAEQITKSARTAGKQASEGAITGLVTGITKAPFKLIGDIGKSLVVILNVDEERIADEDREIINSTMRPLLVSGAKGDSQRWQNGKNNHKGTITLTDIVTLDNNVCKTLYIETILDNDDIVKKNITACMNDNSEWDTLDKSSYQPDF